MGVSYLKNSVSQSDYTYIADNRLVDNMKKTILCFLLIMITLICCIGCSQSASYKVLEAGGCDSVVNANHKAEFDNFLFHDIFLHQFHIYFFPLPPFFGPLFI